MQGAVCGQLIDVYLSRDLERAHASGRIALDSVPVARDLVQRSIFNGIETMLAEPTRENHPEHLMRSVLVGLGLSPEEAQAIAFLPLAALLLFGGLIEWLQTWMPQRQGEWADLLADAAELSIGAAMTVAARRWSMPRDRPTSPERR